MELIYSILAAALFTVYTFACNEALKAAKKHKQNAIKVFVISFFLTPIIGFLMVIANKE